jgi:hypothetical protein
MHHSDPSINRSNARCLRVFCFLFLKILQTATEFIKSSEYWMSTVSLLNRITQEGNIDKVQVLWWKLTSVFAYTYYNTMGLNAFWIVLPQIPYTWKPVWKSCWRHYWWTTLDDALEKQTNNFMHDAYICVYACSLQSLLYEFLVLTLCCVIFCTYSRLYIQQFLLVGYVQLRGGTEIMQLNLLIIKTKITVRNS